MDAQRQKEFKEELASTPCAHGCGRPSERYSSGTPECWACWNRRKLDLPAARHWGKVSEEFLSNVDFYDFTKYLPKCGLSKEEIEIMIVSARKVRDFSKKMVEAGFGPVEDEVLEENIGDHNRED